MSVKNKVESSDVKSEMIVIEGFAKIKKENIMATFGSKTKILGLVNKYKKEQLAELPDVSTKKGRERIASRAYEVSKKKNAIVKNVIDVSTKETKDLIKSVNAGKSFFESEMDMVRDEVRGPLNKWETAAKEKEEQRISAIRLKIKGIVDLGVIPVDSDKDYIESMLDAVENIDCNEGFDEFTQEALQARASANDSLSKKLNELIKKELEEEQQKILLEQQERLNKEQLRINAQERILKLRMIPTEMFDKTSGEIDKKSQAIVKFEIKESEFGELKAEAQVAVDNVLLQLKSLFGQKLLVEKAQEAEELKRQQQEPAEQDKAFASMVETGQVFVDCNGKGVDPEELNKPAQQEQIKETLGDSVAVYETPNVSERLGERFKDVEQEKPEPTLTDVEEFIYSALNYKNLDHAHLMECFGYLFICEDSILIKEAVNKLRSEFKEFFSNK